MNRYIANLNANWTFSKLPKESGLVREVVEATEFDDSAWECVNLPHTWNDKEDRKSVV